MVESAFLGDSVMVTRLTLNQESLGSSPSPPTKSKAYGGFYPTTLSIVVDWKGVKGRFPSWRRRVIGVWVHELTHLFQWVFLYAPDAVRWNASRDKLEAQADRVQNFSLDLMLVPKLRG